MQFSHSFEVVTVPGECVGMDGGGWWFSCEEIFHRLNAVIVVFGWRIRAGLAAGF